MADVRPATITNSFNSEGCVSIYLPVVLPTIQEINPGTNAFIFFFFKSNLIGLVWYLMMARLIYLGSLFVYAQLSRHAVNSVFSIYFVISKILLNIVI